MRAGGRASERTGGRPAGRAERLSGGARRGETRSPRHGGGGDRYGRHGRGDGARARAVDPGVSPALAVPPPPSLTRLSPGRRGRGVRQTEATRGRRSGRASGQRSLSAAPARPPARARLLFPAQPMHRSRSPVSPRHAARRARRKLGLPEPRASARITERPAASAGPCNGRAARAPPSPAVPGPARCRRAGDPAGSEVDAGGKAN